MWLARRGWTVTAVDVSATALETAVRNAAEAGLPADAIAWERRDVAASLPDGPFDLVAATFLHSPVELPRTRVLRDAADAVAPGGVLLERREVEHAFRDEAPTTRIDGVVRLERLAR